jgi:zinc protease
MIANATNHPLLPYTEKTLPCGLTLVHKHVAFSPIVGIDIWIHTGAIHDPVPHMGLSHFFEHMFFKGTEKYGVGVMDRIITSLGGYNNAATSLDYTHYYVVLPSSGWEPALEVLLDSLQNPLFAESEIEKERAVINEEIKRHEDNPWSNIYDKFTSASFARCAYARQVLGTTESLATITRQTFLDYLHARYNFHNVTLSVVGDIALDPLEEKLARLLPATPVPFVDTTPQDWPLVEKGNEVVLKQDVNQSYVLLGFPTGKVVGETDEYSLDLLSMILGEGRSCRLHRRLNDELGIVSSVNCGFWTLKHAGLFIIEAVTEPNKVKQVETEIHSELKKLRETITPAELQKVKRMSRADYAFSNEKAISIAHTFGQSRVMASIDHTIHYLDEIEKITIDDLYHIYDTYLNPTRLCRGLLLPKKG